MPTPKSHSMPAPEPGESLDVWATKIAALEADVARGVINHAQGIAGDRCVPKADRNFAQAQAEAVKRAMAKAKRSRRT